MSLKRNLQFRCRTGKKICNVIESKNRSSRNLVMKRLLIWASNFISCYHYMHIYSILPWRSKHKAYCNSRY